MTNSLCHAPAEACTIFWLPLKKQCLLTGFFYTLIIAYSGEL